MKIVMLNTSDRRGGAAVAAFRLKSALRANGIDVKLIVRDKTTDDPDVISIQTGWLMRQRNRLRFLWERFVIWTHNGYSRKNLFSVSIANTGVDLSEMPEVRDADIIHLHWINQGFISLNGIKKLLELGKPVVWTLHDMWPVTGVCHHAWECTCYRQECGQCPFLNSSGLHDLSRKIQEKKAGIYAENLCFVPVSGWLEGKCRESSLGKSIRSAIIPNAVDINLFSPGDRKVARQRLGLPSDKNILLMGAARVDDPVKGFYELKEALKLIPQKARERVCLVLFGSFKHPEALSGIPVETHWRGNISDSDVLRDLYRAADLFLAPSLEDNLPNTVMESLACGTPVVGFRTGGIPEMVDHLENGYLAPRKDIPALAEGIDWLLQYPDQGGLAQNARQKVLAYFTPERMLTRYIDLYRSLLK